MKNNRDPHNGLLLPPPPNFATMGEARKKKRISRSTAIHEAAHGVASCRYGHGFLYIKGGDPRTKENPECRLLRYLDETLDANEWGAEMGFNPVPERWIALRFIIVLLAGLEAEIRQAKISKKSAFDAYVGSGSDFEQVKGIKKRFFDKHDENIFIFKAKKEVEKFVNDPVYWQVINALADLIQARGTILGTDPDVKAITDKIKPIPMKQEIATEWVLKQAKRPKPKLAACKFD